jgi:hypothetical protein
MTFTATKEATAGETAIPHYLSSVCGHADAVIYSGLSYIRQVILASLCSDLHSQYVES